MTILSVRPVKSKLRVGADGERTYDVEYEALSDDPLDGPLTVAQHPDFPRYGDTYVFGNEVDAYCSAQEGVIELKQGRLLWKGVIPFTTKAAERDNTDDKQDPTNEKPSVSGSFVARQRLAEKDWLGDPIFNSAKQPIVGVMIDDSRDSLIVEYNTLAPQLALRNSFKNKCNNADMWGLARRQLFLVRWDWKLVFGPNGSKYVKRILEFHIDTDDDWTHKLLDQGTCELIAGERVEIKDSHGEIVHRDLPLDGHGRLLSPGDPAVYLDKKLYQEHDFSLLGLPDPLF